MANVLCNAMQSGANWKTVVSEAGGGPQAPCGLQGPKFEMDAGVVVSSSPTNSVGFPLFNGNKVFAHMKGGGWGGGYTVYICMIIGI